MTDPASGRGRRLGDAAAARAFAVAARIEDVRLANAPALLWATVGAKLGAALVGLARVRG